MTRRLLFSVALLAGVVIVAGGSWTKAELRPRHPAHKAPCSLRGSKTIYRDTAVRVYSRAYETPDGSSAEDIFACMFRVNKRRVLAKSRGDCVQDLYTESARPPWIAYGRDGACKADAGNSHACIHNLRTGVKRCVDVAGFPPQEYPSPGYVVRIGLTRMGSVAWIQKSTDRFPPYTVGKLDAKATRPVALDADAGIDPHSFAVGGRYIYWTRDGAPQSATMP
jgi:hypothetical protein